MMLTIAVHDRRLRKKMCQKVANKANPLTVKVARYTEQENHGSGLHSNPETRSECTKRTLESMRYNGSIYSVVLVSTLYVVMLY